MGIESWSTTPATNATADGGSINWAEGQFASTVNNTARQMCADVRSAFNDLAWFQYGSGDQGSSYAATPAVYASATSFTIASVNVTAAFHVGRRVRAVGATTGTIWGTISASAFSTNTTVTVTWDSGSLANETLTVSLSQIPVLGNPIPFIGRYPRSLGTISTTADNSTLLQAWLNQGGRLVLDDFIRCDLPLTLSVDASIELAHPGCGLDFSNMTGTTPGLTVTGSQGTGVALSSNVSSGAYTYPIANTSTFAVGMIVRISSTAKFDPVRTNINIGQIAKVVSIVANTSVTVDKPAWYNYLTADTATIYPITQRKFRWRGGGYLLGQEGGNYLSAINVKYCEKPILELGQFEAFSGEAVIITDCYGGETYGGRSHISSTTNLGYGVSVENGSCDITVSGFVGDGCRHATTTANNSSALLAGQSENITFVDCVSRWTQTSLAAAGGDAFDTHSAHRSVRFVRCVSYNSSGFGFNVECQNAEIIDCKVYASAYAGAALANYTSYDGEYVVKGLRIYNAGNGAGATVNDALRFQNGASSATGDIRRIVVDDIYAENYLGIGVYFKNSVSRQNTEIVQGPGIVLNASGSTNANGQIYYEKNRCVTFSPAVITGIPFNGVGWRSFDTLCYNGYDLGRAEFKAGTNSSGTGFLFDQSAGAYTTIAEVKATTICTATNTAKGINQNSVSGVTETHSYGNPLTP